MSLDALRQISQIKRKAEEIIQEKYKAEPLYKLNGNILLWTIQYILFDYIYQISPTLEHKKFTDDELTQLAHWMHLRSMFSDFSVRWDDLVTEIYKNTRKTILARLDGDEDHPMVFVYDCLLNMKEMHIRHPKQSPANTSVSKSVYDECAQTCYNAVDGEECIFGHSIHGKKEYSSLIFTPLPSDADYKLIDPKEGGYDFELRLFVDKEQGVLDRRYNVPDQFNVIITPEWGLMCRLLHNIFHLFDYINTDLVRLLVDDRDRFAKMPWEDVWKELVKEKHFGANMNQFRKVKGLPIMVTGIAQILNIVNGALKLSEKIKK